MTAWELLGHVVLGLGVLMMALGIGAWLVHEGLCPICRRRIAR